MLHRTRLATTSWIAIALILLNVLVPVLAQTLRSLPAGADSLMLAELCIASGMSAADHASTDDAAPPAPADLPAPQHCSFCAHAPITPLLQGAIALLLILPQSTDAPVPTETPRPHLHHALSAQPARAPPASLLG
ncbi:MAG: hypothetical protein RJA44_2431 [Pseudomonadota bacterium]